MSAGRVSTIGPYRLEDRLGAGGMGEVWRAWDERLDRAVAVKLIRPESAEDETVRERFRREARAAAALTHPAVVRIYDIVESGEGDAIVMELVEGEPLSRRIASDPLPVEEAVHLGRQIADGLAAAHRRGILHRDLKTENVIVTPEGDAKILDFGLAKRLEGETEASLTRSAAVVGTFRAMSPEQARGMALDHRSDLFSFGVLLYEMLTGVSPFKSESATDMLVRICTVRQRPVRELRPEVPEELSSLIDHLLEKDPAFRPRGAVEIHELLDRMPPTLDTSDNRLTMLAPIPFERRTDEKSRIQPVPRAPRISRRTVWVTGFVLAALAALVLVSVFRLGQPPPLYLAVPRPTLETGGDIAGAKILATSVRSALLDGLLALENMRLLSPDLVDPIAGSPMEIARATKADELFTSFLGCDRGTCIVTIRRIHGRDGALLWSQSFEARLDRPDLVAEAIHGYLRQAYPDRGGAPRLEVRADDYADFLRLFESFDARREEEFTIDRILERLEAMRRSSPRFLDAFVFESYLLQERFRSTRDVRDLERALDVLKQARELAPEDPRPLHSAFELALAAEDLDRAEEAISALERLQPGDARLLAQRARLLERRGRADEALKAMRDAVERFPSWKHLFWLADMELKQGLLTESRAHLQELLRQSPGNMIGSSLLAQLELYGGDPEEAVRLYSQLIERSPRFIYLTNLGYAQLLLGRFEQAEQNFRRARESQPDNLFAVLNLADACLLLKRREEAADLYLQVLELARKDPTATSNWQISSVRAQALAHLERKGEAVGAVQEALRLAPANAQAAYEASLVFCLLGDRVSALFNARQALAQGIEPRWFSLPWFDPLRSALAIKDASTRSPH